MQGVQKDWLVRTRSGEIIGPFSQAQLYEELQKRRFTPDDEISPSGGHWISAQALNYREGDDFTHTSTRSQAISHATGPTVTQNPPDRDELTPTPEFIRSESVTNPSIEINPGAQSQSVSRGKPRTLRLILAVIFIFALWTLILILNKRPKDSGTLPSNHQPTQVQGSTSFLQSIYQQIHRGDRQGALKALTLYHEAASAKGELEYLVPYAALLITESDSVERARRLLLQVTNSTAREGIRAEALMWLGYSYLIHEKDSEDRAEGYFLESLQLNPKSAVTRYNLGRTYLKKGKYLEAIDYLQLAELEMPDLWLVHIHKGNARALLGHKEDARKSLRTAVDKAPDRWYPYMVYAAFLFRVGEPENARSVFRSMFMKDPSFEIKSPAPFGYYQEEVSYREYRSAFNIAMIDAPTDDREFGSVYLAYLNNFNGEEGANEMKKLERLAEKGNFFARILSLKIAVEHYVDETTLAYRLQRVPTDVRKFGPYAYVVRGDAQMRLGKAEEAIAEYTKGLAVDNRSAAAHFALAQALQNHSKPNEARDHVNQLLSVHPDYIPALSF